MLLSLYCSCISCETDKEHSEKSQAEERKSEIAKIVAAIYKKKPPKDATENSVTADTVARCGFPCETVKHTLDDPVALFTCFLAYLVLLQLTWMVRQEGVLKGSLDATKRAADAAKTSADAYQMSERAWVGWAGGGGCHARQK